MRSWSNQAGARRRVGQQPQPQGQQRGQAGGTKPIFLDRLLSRRDGAMIAEPEVAHWLPRSVLAPCWMCRSRSY